MVSEKFRRQLRQEAERWWAEGWIDAALYEKLAQRYQLREIETAASQRFITILMGLGGILLGLGVITFVAANWQEWSRSFRVVVLLSLFVGVNGAGFYLWRRPGTTPGQQRLGQGLLLTGALILGANMALMSQMFHQSGRLYELFWFWGLGVSAMAYSLRLTSLGILAFGLVETSFWVWWFNQFANQELTWGHFLMRNLALVMALMFVPLAYWCRSRVIFGLAAIATTTTLLANLKPFTHWNIAGAGGLVAIAFTLPPALLWAYHQEIWHFSTPERVRREQDDFGAIAQGLAIVWLSCLFYLFSFSGFWRDSFSPRSGLTLSWTYIDLVVLSLMAGLGWVRLIYPVNQLRLWQAQSVNSGTIACALVVTASLFSLRSWEAPLLAVYVFNLLLFLLAVGLIRDGLGLGDRRTFWGGMGLLILGIVSRMLEYNTELLLKAFVFVLCGVGVIAAGLWFERRIKLPQSLIANPQEEKL